jgi:hypothetical protein
MIVLNKFSVSFVVFMPSTFSFVCAEAAQYDDPSTGLPSTHVTKFHEAEQLIQLKEYDKAKKNIYEVLEMHILESPNFEPLLILAKVQCLAREGREGESTLSEFKLALEIDEGGIKCSQLQRVNVVGYDAKTQKSVFRRMCSSELLQDQYEQKLTNDGRRKFRILKERYTTVVKFCANR